MKDKIEQAVLGLTAILSILISILHWLGLLDGIHFLADKIPALTFLTLGLIAGYLVLERRNKLDHIEHLVITGFADTQKQILQGVALGELLSKDPELHTTINQIAQRYLSAQESGFDIFQQRSKDALLECRDVLNGLERGYLITVVAGKYSYGRQGTEAAQKTIKAIDYEDIESWRTEHLKGIIGANAEASKRDVKIQRVFILREESLVTASDVLKAHKEAGVDVYVISPEDLPSTHLLESCIIVDDRILVVFYFTRDGKRSREERISIEPVEVDRAIASFNAILRCAKRYEETLPGILNEKAV